LADAAFFLAAIVSTLSVKRNRRPIKRATAFQFFAN
jgi:hypothetical protein